jgi:hypothetical protein
VVRENILTTVKLPAFGKSLLAARFQGGHPELIQVIYGEDWAPERNDCPLLAVKADQFAPGLFDWRCVAGVPVLLVNRSEMPRDWARAGVCFLAGELAQWSPYVEFCFSDGTGGMVSTLAYCCRVAGRWPAWWSERLEADYGRRQKTYFAGLLRQLAA